MTLKAIHDAIYYIDPLRAGPLTNWAQHFERCAKMGFDTVLIAPPFYPAGNGDIFLVADHGRLHPQLGDGRVLDVLSKLAEQASKHHLALMLDLVVDRVARNCSTPGATAFYRHDAYADAMPDPRLPPKDRFAAFLQRDDEAATVWWQSLVDGWVNAGIRGFRCDAAHRVAPEFWRRLIDTTACSTTFIASFPGAESHEIIGLAECGFDLACSSSWAWDFQSGWLAAEQLELRSVGRLLAAPELLSSPIKTSSFLGRRRALSFAAAYGEAWLMPMGYEWDEGKQAPNSDLETDISKANARRMTAPQIQPPKIISPAYAPIVMIKHKTGAGDILTLINPSLQRPTTLISTGLVGENFTPLCAGEVRQINLPVMAPILVNTAPGHLATAATGQPRIAIEAICPSVDNGQFATRQIVGSKVTVTADIICDGHDRLGAALLWKAADEAEWYETGLRPIGNDVWTAEFPLERPGRYQFTIEAWVDSFATYRDGLEKKYVAALNLDLEIAEGVALLQRLATETGNTLLAELSDRIVALPDAERLSLLRDAATSLCVAAAKPHDFVVRHTPAIPVDAEREQAAFAAWYEIFPRSQSDVRGQHGTLGDVVAHLPMIRNMGFDVLYFPPIHPIGRTNRKGRNNALTAELDDPGSPYAIGSIDGGHDAIHPDLGSIEDFRALVMAAKAHGLELALDFAVQCSPDHPWLKEHPEWFTWRPDGTVRHAENPPKKYEDIVNVDFYAQGAMPDLWVALRDIVQFWVDEGVRTFRVDNPHTKPLPFWEWLIADIRSRDPGVLFLAEAFTRPKVMYRLAKIGFSQSYTYFTWRNTAAEMRAYLTELTTTAAAYFFRPNFFVNTPDINPSFLHNSGRPGFLLRAALAATLSGLWGVYNGFELCEAESLEGREEYLNSEKYQLRQWDYTRPGNIIGEIRSLNTIRRTNPALHSHLGVNFIDCDNDQMLCYTKTTPSGDNILVVIVSFDPFVPQETEIDLTPALVGRIEQGAFIVDDLVAGRPDNWRTGRRRIRLDPTVLPYAIWRVRPNTQE